MQDERAAVEGLTAGLGLLRAEWERLAVLGHGEVAELLTASHGCVVDWLRTGRMAGKRAGPQSQGVGPDACGDQWRVGLRALSDFLGENKPDGSSRLRQWHELPRELQNKLDPLFGATFGARVLGYRSRASFLHFARKLDAPSEVLADGSRAWRASCLLVMWLWRLQCVVREKTGMETAIIVTPNDLRRSASSREWLRLSTTPLERTISPFVRSRPLVSGANSSR